MSDVISHGPGESADSRIAEDFRAIRRDEADLNRDVERLEHDLAERRPFEVRVNRKEVRLDRQRLDGEQIKQAAIDQHVDIDQGFQLFQELAEGRERQIADHEEIHVHEGDRFTAISPTDNS